MKSNLNSTSCSKNLQMIERMPFSLRERHVLVHKTRLDFWLCLCYRYILVCGFHLNCSLHFRHIGFCLVDKGLSIVRWHTLWKECIVWNFYTEFLVRIRHPCCHMDLRNIRVCRRSRFLSRGTFYTQHFCRRTRQLSFHHKWQEDLAVDDLASRISTFWKTWIKQNDNQPIVIQG